MRIECVVCKYSVKSNLGLVNIFFAVELVVYFAGTWYLMADLITVTYRLVKPVR